MKENHCTENKRNSRFVQCGVVFVVFILACVWISWANKTPECSEIIIQSTDLPTSFDGYRIAQISDLHNAELGENNRTLIQLLEEIDPDLIVLTGDLVDSNHTDMEVALDFAKQATELAPVYYVTGNHESWLGHSYMVLETQLNECGVHVMRDEALFLEAEDDRILLIGMDDPEFYEGDQTAYDGGASQMALRIRMLREHNEEYTILLSHRPELFDTYSECEVDLVFSGHAHGGQFRFPLVGGLVAPNQGLFPEYDAGVYEKNNTCMIVSRGLGNSIIPIRIGNRPEIVVAELHCNEKERQK